MLLCQSAPVTNAICHMYDSLRIEFNDFTIIMLYTMEKLEIT